jgi:hypothetical protein
VIGKRNEQRNPDYKTEYVKQRKNVVKRFGRGKPHTSEPGFLIAARACQRVSPSRQHTRHNKRKTIATRNVALHKNVASCSSRTCRRRQYVDEGEKCQINTRRGRADETPMTFVRVNCRMLCWQRGRFKIDIDTCHEIHKLQQLCTTCYPTLTTDM